MLLIPVLKLACSIAMMSSACGGCLFKDLQDHLTGTDDKANGSVVLTQLIVCFL